MFERELRDLAFVSRWAIARTIHRQSVAEHSYFVTIYALQLCQLLQIPRNDVLPVVVHSLTHDMDECFTGDIPGPAKRAIRDETKYDSYIKRGIEDRFKWITGSPNYDTYAIKIVKTANLIDEVLYLCSERQLGNQSVEAFYQDSIRRLRMAWDDLPWLDVEQKKHVWKSHIEVAINSELTQHSKLPPEHA